ncbi:hypothetical protein RJ639_014519, partial [Escallonia herrerae]
MNWVQRKIYLYNVTFGLYMLDWWERCLFSILLFRSNILLIMHTLVIMLMWFVCLNGYRYAADFCK